MRDDGTTLQPCLIAGTAVRHSGESFQNYATAADTAPSCTLTPLRNDTALLAQPRKRLPLNMVISEAASRDSSHGSEENFFTTRRESEIQCQCHSDATNLDDLSATLEGQSSLKRFKVDVTENFSQESYSTPYAKSQFTRLYRKDNCDDNSMRSKSFTQEACQSERLLHTDCSLNNSFTDDSKKEVNDASFMYNNEFSASVKPTLTSITELPQENHENGNEFLSPLLFYSDPNLNTTRVKESPNQSLPSLSSCSNTISCSDHEYEQKSYTTNLVSQDSYSSVECFLQPLEKFKLNNTKSDKENLLYSLNAGKPIKWEKYMLNNNDYIYSDETNSNGCIEDSVENFSEIGENYNTQAAHVESDLLDLSSSCTLKYTRQMTNIKFLTKTSGKDCISDSDMYGEFEMDDYEIELSPLSNRDYISDNNDTE